jgi:hypothetical protein
MLLDLFRKYLSTSDLSDLITFSSPSHPPPEKAPPSQQLTKNSVSARSSQNVSHPRETDNAEAWMIRKDRAGIPEEPSLN